MKPHTLPVKRRPVPKGIFKRLSAVTGNRKQRVAAAGSASDMESDDSSSKISRALTIIFLIHIVAIGLIFVHQKFLDGRAPEETKSAAAAKQESAPVAAVRRDLPRIASGEKPYIVRQGDNYARIAATLGVDEQDLRVVNQHVDIVGGLLLKVPPKRAAAQVPQVVATPERLPADSSDGLVEAVDVRDAPRATLVRPNISAPAVSAASGSTYVVKNGDSIWRIANRYKVSQEALMKANGIVDARKIKAGMNLVIPR